MLFSVLLVEEHHVLWRPPIVGDCARHSAIQRWLKLTSGQTPRQRHAVSRPLHLLSLDLVY